MCAGRRAGGRAGRRVGGHTRVGAGAGARGLELRNGVAGEDDLHVDASAVAGEVGQLVGAGGGANVEQLVRGGNWIVRRAHGNRVVPRFVSQVPHGGQDQNMRFATVRCV